MAAPRPTSQAERALAFGTKVRQLRRQAKLTQRDVAARIPMSAGNLSRIENGDQGPPGDETIEQLATAVGGDVSELFKLAGRSTSGQIDTARVLTELDLLRREVRAGFERVERRLPAS